MSANWSDRLEQLLIVLLAGYVFWPNAVSSSCLMALLALRLFKSKKSSLIFGLEWIHLTPALLIFASWLFHGFATDGIRELQLWLTWIAALFYLKTSVFRSLFKQSFVAWSALQATLILVYFTFSDPIPGFGFSQHIRDSIETHFHLHPTFLAVAWSWAILLVWIESHLKILLRIALTIFMLLMVTLTGGKMPFIALLATGLVILAFHKRISLTWKLGITGILLLVVSALALSPSMHSRFQEISDLKVSFEEGDLLSSTDLRVGVWRCDLTVIKDHFWSGVGAGNTRDVLEACYEGYSQVEFFEGEYNSHNQFAHFWLTGGVFSFIAFILYVLWLFRISWIHQNFPLFCFLIFFSLIIFTENYFSRQFGMMFWSFFVAIFALPERKV